MVRSVPVVTSFLGRVRQRSSRLVSALNNVHKPYCFTSNNKSIVRIGPLLACCVTTLLNLHNIADLNTYISMMHSSYQCCLKWEQSRRTITSVHTVPVRRFDYSFAIVEQPNAGTIGRGVTRTTKKIISVLIVGGLSKYFYISTNAPGGGWWYIPDGLAQWA